MVVRWNFVWIAFSIFLFISRTICGSLNCSVIIDAGSTGTRIFVYGWNKQIQLLNEKIQLLGNASTKSPITEIDNISQAYELFNGLIQFAKNTTDKYCNDNTLSYPVHIKATAGMRLLAVSQQEYILSLIDQVMTNKSFNPFLFKNGYASVISGKKEGLFEWIAINYMNNNNNNNTFGLITSGGASIQISMLYHENDTNHNHFIEFKLQNNNDNMKIYSQSYLGVGHKQMLHKVSKLCYDKSILNNDTKIKNPCLLEGYTTKYFISKHKSMDQIGTWQPHECKNIIKQIFHLNGINIHQPKFSPSMTFYATQYLSKYKVSYKTSYKTSFDICKHFNQSTSENLEYTTNSPCFDAIYSKYLLSDIFKFVDIDTSIVFTESYSWTLGFLLYSQQARNTNQNDNKRDFVSKYGVVDDLICINRHIPTSNSDFLLQNPIKECKSVQMKDRIKQIYNLTALPDPHHSNKNLTNYDILSTFLKHNITLFIHGGMVRDSLLGIDAIDMDLHVYCTKAKIIETVSNLGWYYRWYGGSLSFVLSIRTDNSSGMKLDIGVNSIPASQISKYDYDVNDLEWNYDKQTLIISENTLHSVQNRIIAIKSYGFSFHEWCYIDINPTLRQRSNCLWRILRAWKLRISPKLFKWDYYLWNWIKSTIITDFLYQLQLNDTYTHKYNQTITHFFNAKKSGDWTKRSAEILHQMKLDLGEALFNMFIPETVINYHKHDIEQFEMNDPHQWVMKCDHNLLICDIEIVKIKTCGHNTSIFNPFDFPSRGVVQKTINYEVIFGGFKINSFIFNWVGAFAVGIISFFILHYCHKCCNCFTNNKSQEYEDESDLTDFDETETDLNVGETNKVSNVLKITDTHMYVLLLNTLATYGLHRFIGRYSIYCAKAFGITFVQIGYLQTALYLGHVVSVFFPFILQSNLITTQLWKLPYKMLFFSFKIGLGMLTLVYIIFHPFWFLFGTRFLFGLTRCLYSIYRTTFIAINENNISKQTRIFANFSLAKPIGLLILSTFGVTLVHLSLQIAISVLTLPCLLSSVLFLIYFPNNTIKIRENIAVKSSISSCNINIDSSSNILLIDTQTFVGNLGQIGLILGSLFDGIASEIFNICLSKWYHDTFNLNASQFLVVVVVHAFAYIITFVLTTNIGKCKGYNPNNNGSILYLLASCGKVLCFVCLLLFMEYVEKVFALSLIVVSIFYMSTCAGSVAANLLSVNLVTTKNDKSKLIAGKNSISALGMLIGSLLGPSLFTANNFKTTILVSNIAAIGTVIASIMIMTHNYRRNNY